MRQLMVMEGYIVAEESAKKIKDGRDKRNRNIMNYVGEDTNIKNNKQTTKLQRALSVFATMVIRNTIMPRKDAVGTKASIKKADSYEVST